jgi:exopolysaccharide biosynthesis polyprenyl glycosylphosphotransferase
MSIDPGKSELLTQQAPRRSPSSVGVATGVAAAERARFRSTQEARIQNACLAAAALVVSLATTHDVWLAVVDAILISAAWISVVHLTTSATANVRVAIGRAGIALLGAASGAAATSALAFVFPELGITLAGVGLLAGCAFVISLAIAAASSRVVAFRKRVLIVGVTASSRELLETLSQEKEPEFEIVGFVDQESTVNAVGGVPVIGNVQDLETIVRLAKPDLVLVGVERGRPDVFARLAAVAGLGFQVIGLPEFYEQAFGRLPVRHLTDAWFMSVLHVYQAPYAATAKRLFDIAVSICILVLTAPMFLLVALLVKTSRGPVLYKQTRLGEHGIPFEIVKFRTMRMNAETGGAVWAQVDDPRITAAGRTLRETRLDELPQLWNVLKGDMAIVGPRPERPDFLPELEEAVPFWSRRHLLKPGVTGWAQIHAGYAADHREMEQKLAYDLWYLRHQRLVVDVMICLKTLPRLLAKAGR